MNKKYSPASLYKEVFEFLKSSKKFIFIILGVFVLFGLIGFLFPIPDSIIQQILRMIEDLINRTEGMNQKELIVFIFINNLKTSLIGLLFGVLLGIYPLFISTTNGYLIGFISK